MPHAILSCCKIGEYKLPACYIIVTIMLQCNISLKVKYYKQASEADKRPPMPVIKDKKLL